MLRRLRTIFVEEEEGCGRRGVEAQERVVDMRRVVKVARKDFCLAPLAATSALSSASTTSEAV